MGKLLDIHICLLQKRVVNLCDGNDAVDLIVI